MKERIQIDVTREDIDYGQRNASGRCMTARAIKRAIPDASRVEVDVQSIRFTAEGQRWLYLTPARVQDYVIAYDAGDPIDPYRFVLDIRRAMPVQGREPVSEEAREASRANKRARRAQAAAKAVGLPPPDVKLQPVPQRNTGPVNAREVPRRMFKGNDRDYGRRALRINQDRFAGTTDDA